MKNILKNINSQGFAGIIALLTVCSIVLILTFSLSASIVSKKKISKNLSNSIRSYYMAEAGIEDAIYRKVNGLILPSGTTNLDGASVAQTFTTNGDEIIIDSVSNYDNNYRKLKTLLMITTSNVSFHYGVQVGEGGVTMANESKIDGNLYSDGSVIGESVSAKIIGDVIVATGMTLDETKGNWEFYLTDTIFNKDPSIDIAISYTPSLSGKLSQVGFYLKRTNSAPPDGTIKIVTNNAATNSPSTTLVEPTATAEFTASKIGETYGWVNYSFPDPPNLAAGTTYWIVIDVSTSPNKYFYAGTSPGNAESVSKYSADFSSGSWTLEADGDYEFRAWIGGQATVLDSVTISGSARANTIKNSLIGTDAYANSIIDSTISNAAHYAIIDADTVVNGSACLINDPPRCNIDNPSDPAVVAMPLSAGNIADWEAIAAAGENLDSYCNSDSATIVLNAGVMNCDFVPTSVKPVIILNGVVWVKGDIILPNNSIMQLSSGYGTMSGMIIADHPTTPETKGRINTGNGTLVCGSQGYNSGPVPTCKDSNGSYLMLLTTYSNMTSSAIEISNNASGAIYYTFAGIAKVNNNASNVKEVTAYKLTLANGTSVTYESGLANATFSTGPGGGWEIISWNETQ